jgi:hypothetical protein
MNSKMGQELEDNEDKDGDSGSLMSEEILSQIFRAFASEDQLLPSNELIEALAAAVGQDAQYIREAYVRAYQKAGGLGNPWQLAVSGGQLQDEESSNFDGDHDNWVEVDE